MHGSFNTTRHGTSRWPQIATTLSVGVAATLAVIKGIVWIESGSVAILGSLADSLLDLVASVIAFFGVRMAAQPPDHNHRFGHGKAEAISSLVQLVLLTGVAVFVFIEAVQAVMNPEPIQQAGAAKAVMIVSIVLTAILVSVQTYAVRQSASMATESDRAHYVGDFLGNAGILLAVILSANFGILWADGAAGLAAALFLGYSVIDIGRRALPQLMDEELDADERQRIQEIVQGDPDVQGAHALRTRQAGNVRYIQMHVELDPDLSLRVAHKISDRLEAKLLMAFPGADVILHADPHGHVEPHDVYGQRLTVTPAASAG
ncbi:cation diffusion facilitator family transporter [Parvularcula sp. LCG005]|uniref:cation diffusion facilitator family transporter n=1 Tax=Parvularcula sp. LCG005 TaxID=3078805 RepID=UPI002942EBE3|nr:cation diffusion facilitator family transporter [Parvularcula sp. LCG005]WOI52040.1 cation diffusion facilitator family transporter [Parvularcula sp. LCG005]